MTTTPPPAGLGLPRRAFAEFVGTSFLVMIVVGSGIMAQRRSDDDGLQLLENSIATALGLAVLVLVFAPVSGAHFNPLVTLADRVLDGRPRRAELAVIIPAQLVGAVAGSLLANGMFAAPTAVATTDRLEPGTFFAEVVATAGLVLVVFALVRTDRTGWAGPAVGAYIGAAYWFTSSTAFANPAVTVGRMFTDTFAGIAPVSAGAFIVAQMLGAAVGVVIVASLFPRRRPRGVSDSDAA